MSLRFQRRIQLLPSLRINLSKSGVGFSLGARGLHVGLTGRGQGYTSVGLPGTGLWWREYQRRAKGLPTARCELCEREPQHVHVPALVALACLAGLLFGVLVWWGRF